MIELNDDILNKYIDEEFDEELMKKIKTQLAASSEAMYRYKILLSIDKRLREMPYEETSPEFTPGLMLKIRKSLKSKKEQNFFLISVLSLLLLISLGITGYILSSFILSAGSGSADFINQFTEPSEYVITFLKSFFSKGNISIIGSVFSFILLISIYFFYETMKNSRHN